MPPSSSNCTLSDAQRLVSLRNRLGLSQRELAKEFGVTHGAVALWESGERALSGPAHKLLEFYEESLGLKQNFRLAKNPKEFEQIPSSVFSRHFKIAKGSVNALVQTTLDSLKNVLNRTPPQNSFQQKIQINLVKQLVTSMGELKGIAMKVGQWMSYIDFSQSDVIQETFENLQIESPFLAQDQIVDLFLNEFKKTPLQLFKEWNPIPLAAASVGQVHWARLKTGEEVAVKVQYPEILRVFQSDLKAVKLLCHLSSFLFGWVHPDLLFQEFKEKFIEECDYLQEASSLKEFRNFFSQQEEIVIPRLFPDYTTRQILTMEYQQGKTFKEFLESSTQRERNRAGEILFQFNYASIFKHHQFNGDPHPGNYLFQKGKVVFLDFGCVKRYSPLFVAQWRKLFSALIEDEKDLIDELFLEMFSVSKADSIDFNYNREMFRVLAEPFLSKQFEFSPEYTRRAWEFCVARNPNRFLIRVPRDYLFFERLQWGVYSILGKLRAKGNWQKNLLQWL